MSAVASSLTLGLALAADATPSKGASKVPAAAAKTKAVYPAVIVTNLADGKPFDVSSLARAHRTTMVWIFGPT